MWPRQGRCKHRQRFSLPRRVLKHPIQRLRLGQRRLLRAARSDNARELWEQMNTCSCLNLILACIVYWQACEISRVLRECDPIANGIDLSLLEHVSPIEWDNVVLYGQYILDRKLVRRRRFAKRVVLSV